VSGATKRLTRTAYHEAGHAVASFLTGAAIQAVSIVPEGDDLGSVTHRPFPKWFQPDVEGDARHRHLIERRIVVLFAGKEAERRYSGRVSPGVAASDYRTAVNLATYVADGEQTGPFCEWLRVRAKCLVTMHYWPLVEAVAAELLKRRRLTGKQVREIIRAAMRTA
jgi:hypothetical protein